MPRPSSISRLPAEIRDKIGALRAEGRTIDEIVAKLEELNVDVSRSALGRHCKRLESVQANIRRFGNGWQGWKNSVASYNKKAEARTPQRPKPRESTSHRLTAPHSSTSGANIRNNNNGVNTLPEMQ